MLFFFALILYPIVQSLGLFSMLDDFLTLSIRLPAIDTAFMTNLSYCTQSTFGKSALRHWRNVCLCKTSFHTKYILLIKISQDPPCTYVALFMSSPCLFGFAVDWNWLFKLNEIRTFFFLVYWIWSKAI